MKKIILILLAGAFALMSNTDPTPEKVYSITRVAKSKDYYQTQAKLWEAEVNKDKTNKDAWFNYYSATRMTNILTREATYDLNKIVEDIKVHIPNTFESEFIQFWNGNWETDKRKHLKKAYQLDPKRPETYRDMMLLSLREGNKDDAKKFATLLYESGDYSAGLVAWSYNQLMSVGENGILITNGDNDTYFAWMLQLHKGIRPDITVANSWLLSVNDFQKNVLDELGIPEFSKKVEDFENPFEYRTAIIEYIIKNTDRPVYLGAGGKFENDDSFKDNLYIVGLAYKYSDTSFDNFADLRNNYENKFVTDHMVHEFKKDIGISIVNEMNQLYLHPLLSLYKHYKNSGDVKKADELKTVILSIGEKGRNMEYINKYFE